jgi:hypothetical protein
MAERNGDKLWKTTFVEFVAQNGQLPVRDPIQNTDTYIYVDENGQLLIHVEGQGEYQIDVEPAAANHLNYEASHNPPKIPG